MFSVIVPHQPNPKLHYMKTIIMLPAICLCACSAIVHPGINESKKVAETLIKLESSGDYTSMSKYYTDEFNKSESPEERAAKFKDLHNMLGDFVGDTCVRAADSTDLNDFPCVFLKYRVTHTKLASYEEFEIIKDRGELKAEVHNIMHE